MTTTRQFLVSMSVPDDETFAPDKMANRIAVRLLADVSIAFVGMVERTMTVVPLPNLAADDTDLEIGFRTLSAALHRWDRMNEGCGFSEPVALSRDQIAALVAELSKEHPARTAHVDHAALDAVRAIRESDQRPGQQVQKNARAQLIITDAICRCVPDEVA